jgi:drug/metabolite transporter (DMT)-like permease
MSLVFAILLSLIVVAITEEHRRIKNLSALDAFILCMFFSVIIGYFLIVNSSKSGSKLFDSALKDEEG